MKNKTATWFWVAVAALALNLFGCGGNPEPVTGNGDDAGQVGNDQPQTTADAGMPVVDAGSPAADAGNDVVEASAGVPPLTDELGEHLAYRYTRWLSECLPVDRCPSSEGTLSVEPDLEQLSNDRAVIILTGMGATVSFNGILCERRTEELHCGTRNGNYACTGIGPDMREITCLGQSGNGYRIRGIVCGMPDCSPIPRR